MDVELPGELKLSYASPVVIVSVLLGPLIVSPQLSESRVYTQKEVSCVISEGRGACCETNCHEIELQVLYSSSLKLLHFTTGLLVCLEQITAIYLDAKR